MSDTELHNWKKIAARIGPLRYQASDADCVPTTIVNALLFLFQRRIHPRLLSLIWHISVETKHGSGLVSSQLLSDMLNSWFQNAHLDRNEKDVLQFESRIIQDDAVHLMRNNGLARTLNSGGVCCVTTEEGRHYVLVLAKQGSQYLAFDPWWVRGRAGDEFGNFHGLVNRLFYREELVDLLTDENNRWVHVITPLPSS